MPSPPPGATVRGIAEDLGIVRGTLTGWLRESGTGKKTDADGSVVDSPVHPASAPADRRAAVDGPRDESPEAELTRLRARVAELEVNERKLVTERDILQTAAKYFAGETRW